MCIHTADSIVPPTAGNILAIIRWHRSTRLLIFLVFFPLGAALHDCHGGRISVVRGNLFFLPFLADDFGDSLGGDDEPDCFFVLGTHYAVLRVSVDADMDTIRRAYLELSRFF